MGIYSYLRKTGRMYEAYAKAMEARNPLSWINLYKRKTRGNTTHMARALYYSMQTENTSRYMFPPNTAQDMPVELIERLIKEPSWAVRRFHKHANVIKTELDRSRTYASERRRPSHMATYPHKFTRTETFSLYILMEDTATVACLLLTMMNESRRLGIPRRVLERSNVDMDTILQLNKNFIWPMLRKSKRATYTHPRN